ncbi:MAG TPA: citrate/2-methylcitrate synthase, partial [Aggregatilineales bacterium]|nr:citrate/2-methylcitrate synthase [Aggregatilineales bacterium]
MSTGAAKGLAGAVVADTRLSKVDGENGRLYYGGYSINDLAENASFEEVVYLLWYDKLPTQAELELLRKEIAGVMAVNSRILDALRLLPKDAHPMGVLRSAVSMLGNFDPDADDNGEAANRRKALRLVGQTTTLTAAWARIREGNDPVSPRSELSLAANFVYMTTGKEPDAVAVNAVNTYLILLADHGFNASTFTARVITSTDGDIYSAVTGAIGALKGPKHGGANEAAMRMFLEIGEVENVESYFAEKIKGEGRRIMGIGHRVYKAPDPRGAVLRVHAAHLAKST